MNNRTPDTTFLPDDALVRVSASIDKDGDEPTVVKQDNDYIVMVKRDKNGQHLRTGMYRPRNLSVRKLEAFKNREDTKVYRTTHTSLVQKVSGMNEANIARFMEKDE